MNIPIPRALHAATKRDTTIIIATTMVASSSTLLGAFGKDQQLLVSPFGGKVEQFKYNIVGF